MESKSQHFKRTLIVIASALIFAILSPPSHGLPQTNVNIFGMEDGNHFTYDDNTTETVHKLDPSSYYPREYWVWIYENNVWVASEMYGIAGGELKLWTVYDHDWPVAMAFDNGLTVAWSPLSVGEEKISTANVGNYPGMTMTVNAKVIGYEQVLLSFWTFDAYKMRLTMTGAGPGGTSTEVTYAWLVPYLGIVKSEFEGAQAKLVSFAIGGGNITDQTDADRDELKDYQELIKYKTDWLDGDTDDDGCLDGAELQVGRNPLIADSEGDVNGDCAVNIADAISALRLITGMAELGTSAKKADVNGDDRIGSEEFIWILQRISGWR